MTIETAKGAGRTHTLSMTVATVLALTVFRWVTLIESPLSLHFDEAQYWDWSRHLAFGYVSKPPMIAWIIAAATHLFGDSEAAIRATAPLLHAITALALYGLASRLYGGLAGFWAALVYITLPSVAYSSLIMSTDTLLLPFWALALGSWYKLLDQRKTSTAIFLGIWIGLGLLSKYAMAYFILCAAAHLIVCPKDRKRFSWRHGALALGVALLLVLPNLIWNLQHGWATFSHTADNADWQSGTRKGGIIPALEFLGSQIGIFGPVLLGVFIWRLIRLKKEHADGPTVFLLCFSLPVLCIVFIQSLVAGAHMNWAAPAYISLTILAVKWCLDRAQKWLLGSMALHMLLLLWLCFCFGGFIPARDIPHRLDLLAKLRGWQSMAHYVDTYMVANPGYSLLIDERKYAVLFNYYLRNAPYKIVIWPFMGKNHSQFAMTNSIDMETGSKTILASRWPEPGIEHNFAHEESLAVITTIPRPQELRQFHLFKCEELKQMP